MKVKTEIQAIIESEQNKIYLPLAAELLEENGDANTVIAALLRYSLKDTLNEKSYNKIGSVAGGSASNNNEKVRLFVAKGHDDGMNADKVIQFLCEEAGVPEASILDIRVFDKFSFITAPFLEAEQILSLIHI